MAKPRGPEQIRREVLEEDLNLGHRVIVARQARSFFLSFLSYVFDYYTDNLRGKIILLKDHEFITEILSDEDMFRNLLSGQDVDFVSYGPRGPGPLRILGVGAVKRFSWRPGTAIARNLMARVLGQSKRRQWGLYIKARKTRSKRAARLYIRVPHK